ncbi:MAG: hypothetical protein V4714_02890 [Bacteroidota bacterium]
MNIENPLLIEILTTLERIDRANKAIDFHKGQADPDGNSIQNYARLKEDFTQQLAQLLKHLDIVIQFPSDKAA